MGASRLRKVCKACNGGWLNVMEQDCVPVIERLIMGELSVLRQADQIKLARVATSIAMVGEYLNRELASTTQQEREEFRRTLRPPPGWFVFVGRSGLPLTEPTFFSEGLSRLTPRRVKAEKAFSSFTMTLGPVLFHILTVGDGTFLDAHDYARRLSLASICPANDWINFALMPALTGQRIGAIRAYAGMSFKQMIERA